jgi:hypothetical protein
MIPTRQAALQDCKHRHDRGYTTERDSSAILWGWRQGYSHFLCSSVIAACESADKVLAQVMVRHRQTDGCDQIVQDSRKSNWYTRRRSLTQNCLLRFKSLDPSASSKTNPPFLQQTLQQPIKFPHHAIQTLPLLDKQVLHHRMVLRSRDNIMLTMNNAQHILDFLGIEPSSKSMVVPGRRLRLDLPW